MLTYQVIKNFLIIASMQFVISTIILLDIPIIRQIIGFIYLTFFPGTMLLLLFRKKLCLAEFIIFSVGISLTLLCMIGLILNFFLPIFNLKPLSLVPLMVGINSVTIIISFLVCLTSDKLEQNLPQFNFNLNFLPFMLPILSIIGILYFKYSNNNTILLLTLLFLITFIGISLFAKSFTDEFYIYLIISSSLALLLQYSIFYRYNLGWDIHAEYYVSRVTFDNQIWSDEFQNIFWGTYNQMLSLTILPSIYSSILNMEIIWIFKIVYPIIFSLVPLGVFQVSKKYFDNKGALIATFLFISQITFYSEMLGLARQMIAEVFLVAFLILISKTEFDSVEREFLFMIFGLGMTVAHYSITYIFLFIISLNWLISYIMKKIEINPSLFTIGSLWVLSLFWFVYSSGSYSFESLLYSLENIGNSLGDFFNISSRGTAVSAGLGLTSPSSVWSSISRIFAYLTEALIVVGFISLAFEDNKLKLNNKLFLSYIPPITLLGFTILLPNFASSLQMTRFYHILLIFISPLLVFGLKKILNFLLKKKSEIFFLFLAFTIVGSYFLFQTSLVYEVVDVESWSIPLSSYRLGYRLTTDFGYVAEQEVFSAKWFSHYWPITNNTSIFESFNFLSLLEEGVFNQAQFSWIRNTTIVPVGSAVYLGEINIKYSKILEQYMNMTSTRILVLNGLDKLYCNGDSEIYGGSEIFTEIG